MTPGLEVADATEFATVAADIIAAAIAAASPDGGQCTVAFSGGTTPAPVLSILARHTTPDWGRVAAYQVDERLAPAGHADRNLTMLDQVLFGPAAVGTVHPMPVESDDPEAGAAAYAALLPDHLDVVLLGLGADGHTASLVPGDAVLEVTDRAVAVTAPYGGRQRMTLTYPTLNQARRIIWLVRGADKAPTLARVTAGDATLPATRISAEGVTIVADRAAAAHLSG